MILPLLGHALATLPVIGALLLLVVANSKRLIRVRQYPMPFVAVVFAIAALVSLHALNSGVDAVLRTVFRVVPFLQGLYDTTWQYVIENTAVVLVFLVVKLLLRRLFDRLFQGERFLGSELVTGVYRYDADEGAWFVRPENASLRTYLRGFYIGSLVLVAVLLTLASTYPTWAGFAAISFPALAALVIGELYFAVNGATRREFTGDAYGEVDRAHRVADYSGLRDVLKDTFPERIVDDAVSFSSADAVETSARIDALARSSAEVDRLAAGYFARIKQSGRVLDSNLVGAAADLMRGRSVLLTNPFYTDLTPYLTFPAYYHLLQYRKCLVVSGRDSIAEDLVGWIAGGLEAITGVPGLWRVDVLTGQGRSDLDVGVLRYADIHNLDILRENDEFLSEVEYVILAEPSRVLSAGQVGLGVLLSRCAGTGTPVFAAFDRNHDGLVDALSHLLKVDMTDVVATALPRGVSTEMVWDVGGEPTHAAVLPAVTRSLGTGTEIAAVALKYHVSQVQWVGSESFPVQDMMWIAGQYYAPITAFAELDVSQDALAEVVTARSNPWDLTTAANRFLVVEDEIRNVYESIRLYSTRATVQGFVNVISQDYLLRDYMVANSRIFSADPKAIPSIVPDYARTERNLVLRLLMTLMTFGMTEAALARELELIGRTLPPIVEPREADPDELDRVTPVAALLHQLVVTHTGATDLTLLKSLRTRFDEDDERTERFYEVAGSAELDAVVERLRATYFFVEGEAEDQDYIGAVLFGHVHQAMLPGQFLTYAGKYYEVLSIGTSVQRRGVVLRRAAEHIRGRRAYRNLRAFRIGQTRIAEHPGADIITGGVAVRRLFADIEVESLGYLDLPSRSDVVGGREVLIAGVPPRAYTHKQLLAIHLPEVSAEVRATIAVLLNELFVTIFPDAHHYVVALTADPEERFAPLLDRLTLAQDSDAIYIVEDSPLDMGLLVAVERHWRRLFEIVSDYLEWQTTPAPEPVPDAAADFVAVFPGDTEEELAERRRVAEEQDAAGTVAPRPPRRRSWWRRLVAWVRARFGRGRRPRTAEPEPSAAPAGEPEPTTPPPAEEGAPSAPFIVDRPDTGVEVEWTAPGAAAEPAEAPDTEVGASPEPEPEPEPEPFAEPAEAPEPAEPAEEPEPAAEPDPDPEAAAAPTPDPEDDTVQEQQRAE